MKLYIASSWRNEYYPSVVSALREAGFDVYDFRNPPSGEGGFKWSYIDDNYMDWTPEQYREQLEKNPLAVKQLQNDVEAMKSCDACVLVSGFKSQDSSRFQEIENSACCKIPHTNREFWVNKIMRNKERDTEVARKLAEMGWHSITIWECELKPAKREGW